jgi:hypothetical protein
MIIIVSLFKLEEVSFASRSYKIVEAHCEGTPTILSN